jgi:hypothetical protein
VCGVANDDERQGEDGRGEEDDDEGHTEKTSAEFERAFSHAKKMVSEERYSLKADIIEAEQCLKNWLISGVVDYAQT